MLTNTCYCKTMIIHIGMFMRKILQYAILVLVGMNSAYAFNPLQSMSNAVSGCKPSLVGEIEEELPNAGIGGTKFHKKVDTLRKCIGKDAAKLKRSHADVAKSMASVCKNDAAFKKAFASECQLSIKVDNAVQKELKAKKDKAAKAKADKAKKPSMFSRMMGKKKVPVKKKALVKKKTPVKKIKKTVPVEDDESIDVAANKVVAERVAADKVDPVCSPQVPGQAAAYAPNAPQMPGQVPSPYGMPQANGQMPYGMTPPPAYGQAGAAPQMYGQPLQYPVNQYYGYPQPQGVYPDPAINGQMPYQQGVLPAAAGSPMSGVQATGQMNAGQMTGQMVNTPQGPICSCPH